MLRALTAQLKLLAADPKNHYTSIIRRLAGPREAPRYEQSLRRMVLALPTLIAGMRSHADEPGHSARVRRMEGFALDYLYAPRDFLSVHGPGLFQYVDEAYLIARVHQATRGSPPGPAGSLAREIPEWVESTRRLLPHETARIDLWLEEVARGRDGGIAWNHANPKATAPARLARPGHGRS